MVEAATNSPAAGAWWVRGPHRTWRVVRRAVLAFFEDQALTHGAAVAFFSGLSLAPILILLVWLSSVLGPGLRDLLVDHVAELVGAQGGQVVRMVIDNADAHVDVAHIAGWISLGTLLFSATAVFAQLQTALNTIWGVRSDPTGFDVWAWLRKRLLSLGLIVSIGFLLLVSLVVSSGLAALTHAWRDRLPAAGLLWNALDLVVPFLVYLLVFMAVFRYLPDAELRWRHVFFGGVVTASLFVVGKWLIGLYLGTSALGSAYGAAGSLVLMLVWTYYSAAIVLFGAELTQAFVRELGERVAVEAHAVADDQEHRSRRATDPRAGVPLRRGLG
ncbi:MAG: YihY/virulence factor BrkB family protein [Planctomycetota bacterium]